MNLANISPLTAKPTVGPLTMTVTPTLPKEYQELYGEYDYSDPIIRQAVGQEIEWQSQQAAQKVRDLSTTGQDRPIWEKIMKMRGEMMAVEEPTIVNKLTAEYLQRIPDGGRPDSKSSKEIKTNLRAAFKVARDPKSTTTQFNKAVGALESSLSLFSAEYLDYGSMFDAYEEVGDKLTDERKQAKAKAGKKLRADWKAHKKTYEGLPDKWF